MTTRRKLLKIGASVCGITAVAGCSSDDSDVVVQEQSETTSAPTQTPSPASQLDVVGFVTGSSDAIQARVDAGNPVESPVTADFSASLLSSGVDDFISEPVEQTIPSGERSQFNIDIASRDAFDYEDESAFGYEPFTLQLSVNGEPLANTCPPVDVDYISSTQRGCEYVWGITTTYVEVEYSGDWQGAVSTTSSQRSVERASADLPAVSGSEVSYIDITTVGEETPSIVSANAQKQEDNFEELTVRIIHQTETVAEQSTSAGFGAAQVSENL